MRVLYPAALALSALARRALAADFSVSCWRTTSRGIETGPKFDADCPVAVAIADLSGSFAPGDSVPLVWNVALNADPNQPNAVKLPLPVPTSQPAGATQPVQIASTAVRVCESIEKCDPLTTPTQATDTQSGNFSSTGDPVVFKSLAGLTFDAAGEFTVGAFASLVGPQFSYHFATYATITIADTAVPTTTQEQGAVRCRTSRQSALNVTLDPSANAADGELCEVRVTVAPIAVAKPGTPVDVAWTATLAQSSDADIRMPSPLIQTDVNGSRFDVVSAKLKLCKSADACDEYTAESDLESVVSAGPQSFAANVASFIAPGVVLPRAGPHLALLQLVIGGQNRRYDYMYYLTLVASDSDIAASVDAATPTVDGSSTLCWSTLADGAAVNVTSASVAASAQGAGCPYTASLSVTSLAIAEADTIDLSWTVTENAAASQLTSNNLTASYDAASESFVTLPTLRLYACSEGTACTPFSPNKTLIFSAPARNLTDGKAVINAEDIKLPAAGTFTLMAHSAVPMGASRVDVAVYASVTVASADTGGSNTLLYVLVSVGSVVGVVVVFLIVVCIRKRRHRKRMDKMVQYGLFGAPASRVRETTMVKATETRSSLGPSEHTRPGSFNYIQADRSPAEYPAFVGERKDSLSYDPYARTSFMEMSANESNMSVNESNLSFAFTDNNFSVDDSSLSFAFTDSERHSSDSEAYDV